MTCSYYQAHIVRSKVWFVAAVLRSFEHLVFERTIDKENSIIEFFVPQDVEKYFLEVMHYFEQQAIVVGLQKLTNRLG
jgi:hypothetical protein